MLEADDAALPLKKLECVPDYASEMHVERLQWFQAISDYFNKS